MVSYEYLEQHPTLRQIYLQDMCKYLILFLGVTLKHITIKSWLLFLLSRIMLNKTTSIHYHRDIVCQCYYHYHNMSNAA